MDKQVQRIIMKNVDRLMKARGIKRGDFERQAGVSTGYISRLSSTDDDKKASHVLSMDVAEKFAKALGVSVDYLQFDQDVRRDERVVMDFLESVYFRTKEDEVYWEFDDFESVMEWATCEHWQPRENLGPITIWLYNVDETQYTQVIPYNERIERYLYIGRSMVPRGRKINGITYKEAELTGPIYYVELEDINAYLYLYRVRYKDGTGEKSVEDVIESYLQQGELRAGTGTYEPNFLCNSIEWNDYIKSKLNDIYNMAADRCENARISQEAWEVLDGFYRKILDEPNEVNEEQKED